MLHAQLKLPKLINDNMVQQRDTELTLRGWAAPGEEVSIEFNGQHWQTTTKDDSTWQVKLPPQKAGGPYELNISATNILTLQNVLFGDVWLASGQSNMELPMYRVAPLYQEEMQQADYPKIRYFNVPDTGMAVAIDVGEWNDIHPLTKKPWASGWHNLLK